MVVPGKPKVAESPQEVLNSPGIERGLLSQYYAPVLFGLFGFGLVATKNWSTKRPLLSGIQKHILATAIGVPIGFFVNKWLDSKLADRDAMLRHYVQLHPEDFPPYERKQFKDILLPWVPIR
ncbi:hypothetical protein ABEB36_004027 [Hypothenemus hampei]|uniref:NADH dehydrogenase [ubiquinone] 1 subunit C2 n=1 Tax=Hypothenemus hampei TaxID=57062 RepID=A0ABD1F1Y4_HYPHA